MAVDADIAATLRRKCGRGAWVLLACLLAGPAAADEAALRDFMGGQGCTFGPDSRAAAGAAGFDDATIDALIKTSLADGTASKQRAYTVLDATICIIRLPDIQSAYSIASPEIVAITSAIDAYAEYDEPGCFVEDALDFFNAKHGGDVDAGFADYIAFVGAGLIAGDLRFYSPSPLRTPVSFQNVRGDCAAVPDIAIIEASHVALTTGFGGYVRAVGAAVPCAGDESKEPGYDFMVSQDYGLMIQGADPARVYEDQPGINAWLWFEYDMITLAAGWHEGVSGTEKGTPRPPLCHY